MKCVILAAGKGTRMRPLTENKPKVLLPVAGRPLIEHVLNPCVGNIDEFVLVVGYREKDVKNEIGEEYRGIPVRYISQEEQKGTAHAIGLAKSAINERFLVLNGDLLIDDSLISDITNQEGNVISVMEVDSPEEYGVVEVENGTLKGLVEKPDNPRTNLANMGVYVFEPSIFDFIEHTGESKRGEIEITDSIRSMIDEGHYFSVYRNSGRWMDVGRPWELLEANQIYMDDLEKEENGEVDDGVSIEGKVKIEKGARIQHGSCIKGPVIVKRGANVGPNAYVRDRCVIGENVRVGQGVEVKNSILMEDAKAPHLSYIGDSVVSEGVNLGAGTMIGNLRHDDSNVQMIVKNELVDTGRRKMGAVIGDNAKTGINTSLNPGVKLGVSATTNPGEVVLRDKLGDGDQL